MKERRKFPIGIESPNIATFFFLVLKIESAERSLKNTTSDMLHVMSRNKLAAHPAITVTDLSDVNQVSIIFTSEKKLGLSGLSSVIPLLKIILFKIKACL